MFMACNTNHPKNKQDATESKKPLQLDTIDFKNRMKILANNDTTGRWPIKNQSFPLPGAMLPFKRIVAYYGNLNSKRMGVLGEFEPKEMWRRLQEEVKQWEKADSLTPVQPALHYIVTVAQADSGVDGKYRLRMNENQIDSILTIAKMGNAIVFLDIQVGLSNLKHEIPVLEKYLKMDNVHLGIDPEFSMKDGTKPGKKIGTFDASDINYASDYLATLVSKNHLTPKILVVHRFTKDMITNYKKIKIRPEVQIVIDMDGWGSPALKKGTHYRHIYSEPVQFTGFKLFYKNDIKHEPFKMLTPSELLKITPRPIYIQYQ